MKVIKYLHSIPYKYKDYTYNIKIYLCECPCGNMVEIRKHNLKRSKMCRSCAVSQANRKHGLSRNIEEKYLFTLWSNIVDRCTNHKHPSYKNYGGRGIQIIKEWEESPAKFIDYIKTTIGHRPSKGHSLDRIDVNAGYQPNNLRWASRVTQSRNRTDNLFIEMNNQTRCLSDWATELKISPSLMRFRYKKYGNNFEELSKQVKQRPPRYYLGSRE